MSRMRVLLVMACGAMVGALVVRSLPWDLSDHGKQPVGAVNKDTTMPAGGQAAGPSAPTEAGPGLGRRFAADNVPVPSGYVRASELPAGAKKCLEIVNNTLRGVGDEEISGNRIIASEDISVFESMATADNDAIRDTDKSIRKLQGEYVPEMVKTIQEHVAQGKAPPYQNITGSSLPKQKHPYDFFITTSHQGSVYLMTLPYTPQVMDLADRLRNNESMRLTNIRSVLKPLFKETSR